MEKLNRSPFFYVGDKYKLLKQLLPLFLKVLKEDLLNHLLAVEAFI